MHYFWAVLYRSSMLSDISIVPQEKWPTFSLVKNGRIGLSSKGQHQSLLFSFDLDRLVIDLAWKISHGVLYTDKSIVSFAYDLSTTCFCSDSIKSIQHLFFYCPLAVSVLSWVRSLMFLASPLCPALLLHHALFGFSLDELSVVPRIFC